MVDPTPGAGASRGVQLCAVPEGSLTESEEARLVLALLGG